MGKIIVCNNKVYAGKNRLDLTKDTVYNHPSSIQCNASSEINSLKSSVSNGKNLIANAITGKGVATSSSDTFATMANNISALQIKPNASGAYNTGDINGDITGVGNAVRFDAMNWIVVHVTNGVAYLGRDVIVSYTIYRPSEGYNDYTGSTLAQRAQDFENNMSEKARSVMMPITVNDVTSKVFVPSEEQVSGGFSYFNSDSRRICQYNGSNSYWWTSSPGSRFRSFAVSESGAVGNFDLSSAYGFRPFIALTF